MDQSKPVAKPLESGTQLINEESEIALFDQKSYQSAVGSLHCVRSPYRKRDFVTNG